MDVRVPCVTAPKQMQKKLKKIKKKITPNGENGVYVVDQENEGWDPFLHGALTTISQTNVKKKK